MNNQEGKNAIEQNIMNRRILVADLCIDGGLGIAEMIRNA
jgi:hypothetical protein